MGSGISGINIPGTDDQEIIEATHPLFDLRSEVSSPQPIAMAKINTKNFILVTLSLEFVI